MLTQKLILSYSSRMGIQFIQMVVGVVVARIAGPTVIGTVAFGLSYVSMFLFITDMGTPTAHIKLINDGENEGDCIVTFATIKFFLIGIFVFVILSIFFWQKFILKQPFETKTHEVIIFITLGTILINEFYKIINATFVAHVEQAKQDIPQIIYSLIFQILRLSVVLLGYRAIAIVSSKLIAVLCVAPLYYYFFRRYPLGKFDMQLAKKYLTISLPVIIVVFSQTVIYWSDRVILQFLTNSVEVGFYVAAFGFSNFIRLIQNSAGTIFFPTFTKHLSNGDYFKINNLIKKYERFNFIFVMPFIMFSAIYSKTIIKIVLGSKYLPTIPIFSIIMIAVFIPVLSLPYGNIIFGKGMFKLSAKISFIAMIYFVIIIFILSNPVIFDLKGVGVALGLLSTNLFLWIMFVVFSKKYIPEIKVLKDLKIGIIGIIYSVLFFFLFKILANGFIVKTVMALIFFIGYWGVLFLFKKISKKDLFFIREILNINKMKKYVKDEISIKE